MAIYHSTKCTKSELQEFKKEVLVFLKEKGFDISKLKIKAFTCYNGDVRVYLGELTSPNRRSSFRREREAEDGKGYYGTRGHHETTIRLYHSFNRDEFTDKEKESDFMQDMLDSIKRFYKSEGEGS